MRNVEARKWKGGSYQTFVRIEIDPCGGFRGRQSKVCRDNGDSFDPLGDVNVTAKLRAELKVFRMLLPFHWDLPSLWESRVHGLCRARSAGTLER